MIDNAQHIGKLRDWLATTNAAVRRVELDTRLIEEGVLDSLQMVNFILYIEEVRGRELPEAFIQPEYFVSLRIIHDTFFSDQPRRA